MSPSRPTIAQAHGTTFSIVRLQKSWPCVTLQSRGQLPADVEGVPNTRIHSIATRRNELVGGISRKKDPSTTVALSNEQMWVPGIRNEHLEWERTFREAVKQRGRLGF